LTHAPSGPEETPGRLAHRLGLALADRVRLALDFQHRYQGFAFSPPRPEVDTDPSGDEPESVPNQPATSPAEWAAFARQHVARALAVACRYENLAVLQLLRREGDRSVAALAQHFDLAPIAVMEIVTDLNRMGLIGHRLDGDLVSLNPGGQLILDLIDQAADGLTTALTTGPKKRIPVRR
jgi:DNA-binding MarR family transcriptional regulator